MFRPRADEGDVMVGQNLGEPSVLGEKSITGMQRLGSGDFAGGKQRRNIEIGFACGGRPDADQFVGELHMHGVGVGGGVHRDRRNAELLRRAQDAQGDFAAVGDENFFEHVSPPEPRRSFDHEERLAIFDGLTILDENAGDSASDGRDNLIERLHGFDEQ